MTGGASVACEPVGDHAPLLPEPLMFTGDVAADFAVLMIQLGQQDEKVNDAIRASEERLQSAAEASQLERMAEKAEHALWAGVAGGLATAGAGALSLGGIGGAGEVNGWTCGAKMLEGGGRLATAWAQRGAATAEIDATHEGHLAGQHARAANDARESSKANQAFVDRMTDLYKEYNRTRIESQEAAILRA